MAVSSHSLSHPFCCTTTYQTPCLSVPSTLYVLNILDILHSKLHLNWARSQKKVLFPIIVYYPFQEKVTRQPFFELLREVSYRKTKYQIKRPVCELVISSNM